MAKDIKELDAQEHDGEVVVDSTSESFSNPRSSKRVNSEGAELDEAVDADVMKSSVPISELRKVRSEAAKYRKRLRQLESEIEKERKASELSQMEEVDRLKAVAAEAESKAEAFKERADVVAKQAAIINSASSLGFYNPKDAASILDLAIIEVDNDGVVDEDRVSELVKSLAESRPYLVREQQDSQEASVFGPTNPASSNWPKPKFRGKAHINRLKHQSTEAMKNGKIAAAVRLYNQAWEIERDIKKTKG